jgi:hypothetical protein
VFGVTTLLVAKTIVLVVAGRMKCELEALVECCDRGKTEVLGGKLVGTYDSFSRGQAVTA